jgi:hypothetical protein
MTAWGEAQSAKSQVKIRKILSALKARNIGLK